MTGNFSASSLPGGFLTYNSSYKLPLQKALLTSILNNLNSLWTANAIKILIASTLAIWAKGLVIINPSFLVLYLYNQSWFVYSNGPMLIKFIYEHSSYTYNCFVDLSGDKVPHFVSLKLIKNLLHKHDPICILQSFFDVLWLNGWYQRWIHNQVSWQGPSLTSWIKWTNEIFPMDVNIDAFIRTFWLSLLLCQHENHLHLLHGFETQFPVWSTWRNRSSRVFNILLFITLIIVFFVLAPYL